MRPSTRWSTWGFASLLLVNGFALSTPASVLRDARLGTSFRYDNAMGDTWYNTWGDDGEIYATADDTMGFNGDCRWPDNNGSNLTFHELSGDDPTRLKAPFVNCMRSYAHGSDTQGRPDGATWKTEGIISVDGTIYVVVARQVDGFGGYPNGYQISTDASIIKSSDHGRHWSNGFGTVDDPDGAAPPYVAVTHTIRATFPGKTFSTPQFINYGKDDAPASTADGGNTYVYAISNDGFAYDGSLLILGRVRRDQIGKLDGADWQYYLGGDGMDSRNWAADVSKARPILSEAHRLSHSTVQYIAELRRYVLISFYYPFNAQWPDHGQPSHSVVTFYQAPAPWGPWAKLSEIDTTPYGRYDPALVSKFSGGRGLKQTLFTCNDWTGGSVNGDTNYRLHILPLTLSLNGAGSDTSVPTLFDFRPRTFWPIKREASYWLVTPMVGR